MIKIALADDHPVVRDGFQLLLEKEPEFNVVGVASDGRDLLQQLRTTRVDVVVMDINMPNLSGIEAARQIKKEFPEIKIVALSIHTESELVAKMIQAGASGYLPKSSVVKELIEAVRMVMSHRTYLSPRVSDSIVNHMHRYSSSGKMESKELTSREKEILQLISEGKTTLEIAGILSLSENTIESHRKRISNKLDIHNIAGLTRYAITHGLTSLEY